MTPKKRNQDYYLNDIPLEDAIKSYFDSLSKKNSFAKKKELIKINDSLAKVTAEAIWPLNASHN